VTAATLRATDKQALATIKNYTWVAVVLGAFIIPWSVWAFVFAGINNSLTANIANANQLTVSLHSQLEAPATPTNTGTVPRSEAAEAAPVGALSDLQDFAATIRSVYRHTKQLTPYVYSPQADPLKKAGDLELDPGLVPQMGPLRTNLDRLTLDYQQIRSYAKYTQDDWAAVSGAITACVLPIFYALLGASAYLLRVFSSQPATKTFAPSYSTIARFVIAAIAGSVVGLFNNFGTSQVATLSPLAIAFVSGYAADVFFAFIDGAVQAVSKPRKG
jgi:hypothetical protein